MPHPAGSGRVLCYDPGVSPGFVVGLRQCVVVGLVVCGLLSTGTAQQPSGAPVEERAGRPETPRREIVVHERRAIECDADLGEWNVEPTVRLDRGAQVLNAATRGAWGGTEDLSAAVWLAYDQQHLYVAGRVRDDSPVGNDEGSWNHQDAIELFVDLDGPRGLGWSGAPEDVGAAPDPYDAQIFLMPWAKRPWGVMHADGRKPLPGTNLWTGVRTAFRRSADGWTFECALPFHNFSNPWPDNGGSVGFDIAIDDMDAGTDRYQYMSLSGTSPHRAGLSGRLRFAGQLPLHFTGDSDPGFLAATRSWLAFLWPIAAVSILVLLLARAWIDASVRFRGLRPVGRALGVLLFSTGLLLPGCLEGTRTQAGRRKVRNAAEWLQKHVPAIEAGALGSYRGGRRDEPLAKLLRGGTISPEAKYSYVNVEEFMADEERPGVRSLPGVFGFDVRHYFIPLEEEGGERFDFAEPLPPGQLNVVLARPAAVSTVFNGIGETFRGPTTIDLTSEPIAFAATLHTAGSTAPEAIELEASAPRIAAVFDREDLEFAFKTITFDEPLEAVSLASRGDELLQLVGMTWVSDERRGVRVQRPLDLGETSLGGVETGLRGPWPTEAGFALAAVQGEHRIEFADDVGLDDFAKLWLIYRGEYADVEPPDPGDVPVATLEIGFRSEREPLSVEFVHQQSMFFSEVLSNRVDPGSVEGVRVAARYGDRIDVGREIDLPADESVAWLQFRNTGPYTVRFRSLILGARERTPGIEPTYPLTRPELFEEKLLPAAVSVFDDLSLAIYRGGRLTVRDVGTDGVAPPAFTTRRGMTAIDVRHRAGAAPGTRVHEASFGLAGNDWAGTCVVLSWVDRGYGRGVLFGHRIGLLLGVIGLPFVLLLLGEAMVRLNSLRLQLMAVLVAATVVPLTVLFIVLVQVLESSHERARDDRLRGSLRDIEAQVERVGRELGDSAKAWLEELQREVEQPTQVAVAEAALDRADIGAVDGGPTEPGVPTTGAIGLVEQRLTGSLHKQFPPAWQDTGGFMRLDLTGDEPVRIGVGAEELSSLSISMREEPGLYLVWGSVVLGVRHQVETRRGSLALTVGQTLDAGALTELVGEGSVLLSDLDGYVLASGGEAHGRMIESLASMQLRAAAAQSAIHLGQPTVSRHVGGSTEGATAWLGVYDVLRDFQGTPRVLLGLLERETAATVPLAVGRIPVRSFFVLVAAGLVGLSLFLSFVVTHRISRPMDRLEQGADALARGELDIRVDCDENGQIKRLTTRFNRMAEELRARIQDLGSLNRGIRELSLHLELDDVVQHVVAFYRQHTPADGVAVLLVDEFDDAVEVRTDSSEPPQKLSLQDPALRAALESSGPFSLPIPQSDSRSEGFASRFATARSALIIPMRLASRAQGAIVLLFDTGRPAPVPLDLASTMAMQATAAFANARLYKHAVEDLVTGALQDEPFRRRVREEVERARGAGTRIGLIGVRVGDGVALAAERGRDGYGQLLARLVRQLRNEFGGGAVVGRWGQHELQVALPLEDSQTAVDCAQQVRARGLGPGAGGLDHGRLRLLAAAVEFPDDGASAEFLFDALRSAWHSSVPGDPVASARRRRSLAEMGVFVDSSAMETVVQTLERVAPTDLSVLFEGETGTGKEVLANVVHAWSRRAAEPLVKVHCAAIPSTLLEAELFGYERGAFTGASERRAGRFEQAQGGTVFLDEIGEVPADVQVKLLRVLQEREVDRIGGVRPVPVDVRILAATHRDLSAMVRGGSFREDLYYRLQGMVVRVPPLRERRPEIAGLLERFRAEACRDGQATIEGFDPEVLDELFRRPWPGNIRELRNVAFRAMVLARGGRVTLADLEVAESGGTAEVAVRGKLPTVADAVTPAGADRRDAHERAPAAICSPRQLELLSFLISTGEAMPCRSCAQALGVSERTCSRELRELVEMGLVDRQGVRRGARYMANAMAKKVANISG